MPLYLEVVGSGLSNRGLTLIHDNREFFGPYSARDSPRTRKPLQEGDALILEKQVLTILKAVEDKIDDEISALDHLDLEDIKVLRVRTLQQMKKMAEKRR
ncbi:hypothetical protein AgCh_000223 [Apium graveolens]